MHLPAPGRSRPWWTRRGLALSLIGAATLLAFVVARQLLPHQGPGWYLYALHDRVWLPLRALVWTRAGAWSLLWLVPVLALAFLVLVEFLGLAQPLRRMQVAVLRGFLRSRFSHLVLAAQQRLGWRRGHEGQLVAVLEGELARGEAALKEAAEAGLRAGSLALSRSVVQLAYLRAADPVAQLRGAEDLMLIALHSQPEHVARVSAQLRRIWPEEDGARIDALLKTDPAEPEALFDLLRAPSGQASDLALATLAMARPDALRRADLVRDWFTEWARIRHDWRQSGRLSDAEQLIDFEFWAARAEAGLVLQDLGGDRSGWLAGLLPDLAMCRPMGELAAAGLMQPSQAGRDKAGQ